ncbi:hypothetical protein [Bdellovibrio sp. HCB274]|uniref:hypothetical protein n=1 Tax=Bdellovibrio sp. HCB274 TaxID=3394361 RepID=UPI0039B6C20E
MTKRTSAKKTATSSRRKADTENLKQAAEKNFPRTQGQRNQFQDASMSEKEFGDEDYDYESRERHSGRRYPPEPEYYNSPNRGYDDLYPKRPSRNRPNSRNEVSR